MKPSRLRSRWPLLGDGASLRSRLLLGILLPVIVLVALNTVSLYREALESADTAYDRTLLASAKSIGELLEVTGSGEQAAVKATVLYSALEAFEADNRSRLYYRVTGFQGEPVSGFQDLPRWRGRLSGRTVYAALVDFYDDVYRGQPVRMAVLLQPVASATGQGMATIQVAETLELRHTLARQILLETLWHQIVLVLVIAAVVVWVVQRATRPVLRLSRQIEQRPEGDLTPLQAAGTPAELLPLVDATNEMMARLAQLLEHQKRFVRDASHQLRTPMAVLKTQVQSARRGDVEPAQALREIEHTVDRATDLANQMLALAKVEQLRHQGNEPRLDWAGVTREIALDLSALIAGRELEFLIETVEAPVRAHEWALRELVRNLLHNAIKCSPAGSALAVRLVHDGRHAALTIADGGPGIADALRDNLFRPFATGGPHGDLRSGSGLGLAICREIVHNLGGELTLDNRIEHSRITGLDATVRLPLASGAAP
ncbi:two-component system sensor histidine kinase TctE [Sphaerotilus hippei]|uniref:histidine kinase n=1 Tax=Sphaerotilus hippei TaxID=744406 RepID=A0A318GYR6_9BURK|nr:sensor histidine kinase [Sphaerotilus hippei]PXW95011.1 two-component system sensor histidine kinase TctE [Sphaerotilus hippei]